MNRNPDTYWNDEADQPTPEQLEAIYADAFDNPERGYEEPDGPTAGPVEMADDREPPF